MLSLTDHDDTVLTDIPLAFITDAGTTTTNTSAPDSVWYRYGMSTQSIDIHMKSSYLISTAHIPILMHSTLSGGRNRGEKV